MAEESVRIEYIEARRVLLDVLTALAPQRDAVVLVGAQAIYLRTEGRMAGYQPFTTDADVVIDPTRLDPVPPLAVAMSEAGFTLTSEPGIWEARISRPGMDDEIVVPIDLIVPEELAPAAGRRAARLAGGHGKATARKSPGLAGTVVDHSPIEIGALEPLDDRRITVNVAGYGALLVAKLHKLGDRLATPERLQAKDAGDVYRLMDAVGPHEMAEKLQRLLSDNRSSATTSKALAYFRQLFLTPGSIGVRLSVHALRGVIPEATVAAAISAYAGETHRLVDR